MIMDIANKIVLIVIMYGDVRVGEPPEDWLVSRPRGEWHINKSAFFCTRLPQKIYVNITWRSYQSWPLDVTDPHRPKIIRV